MKKLLTAAIVVLSVGCVLPAARAEEVPDEWLQFESVPRKGVNVDMGFRYIRKGDGIELDIAAVATGKGSDFRRWEVTDTKIIVDKDIIRPSSSDKFYSKKESVFRLPAAVVFAAIGSQYAQYAEECGSGGKCSVTGQGTGGKQRGGVAGAIDRAGTAAGMGLLTAQAKGGITGLKSRFSLDKDQAERLEDVGYTVKLVVENTGNRRKMVIKRDIEGQL